MSSFNYIPNGTSPDRVRNPVTPSRITVRGQFPSKKMQRMIAWESQLEKRACYLFEFSSNIISFREQPERLCIPYMDKIKRYTPDFEVILKTGEVCYYEIKPLKRLYKLKDYFNYVHTFLLKRGIRFLLLTEVELMNPTREYNLMVFRKYQSLLLDQAELQAIEKIYMKNNTSALPFEYLENNGVDIQTIYSCIANHYLHCDFSCEINSNTLITLLNTIEGKYDETELFQHRSAPNF